MKKNIGILLLVILANFARAQEKFIITDDKHPPATIIIPNNSGKKLKSLADELKNYLGEISGQDFRVSTNKIDGRTIILGTLQQLNLDTPELTAKFAATGKSHKEAFLIKRDKNSLILTAETELGVSHAVFTLLENLGCRWYFPTKTWTIIPEKRNLVISEDIFDYPKIPSRSIWYQWGFINDEGNGRSRSSRDYWAWCRHNRMARSFQTSVGHIWPRIYTAYKKEFDAHPEYFLWDIKKKCYHTPDISNDIKIDTYNPEVEAIFRKYVLEYFKKHPDADMVGTGPSDGYIYGLMSKSNPDAGTSDICFHGTEVAASALQEAATTNSLYKNKYVGQYAYADYSDPPSYKLPDNVYIELTAGFISGKHTIAELLDIWPEHVAQMGFYRYFSVWQWNRDTLCKQAGGSNVVAMRQYIPDLYHQQHAVAISAESGNNWGLNGRGYYVANKLMWNPDADVDAILDDFYSNAFGPAAGIMKEYYEMFDPGNRPFGSVVIFGKGADLIHQADMLTRNYPEINARIDDLKVFWGHVWLWHKYEHTTDKDEKKKLVKEIATHAYRSRFRYMNHWEAIRQQWIGGGGNKAPEWAPIQKAPWKGMPDYSADEVDVLFKKVRKYFPLQKIDIVNFSNDYVPIKWSDMKDSLVKAESGIWKGGHEMWVYSFGEPIKISIKPGLTGSKKSASCTLRDRNLKIIQKQKWQFEPTRNCVFSFNVPKPGLYQVSIESDFWRLVNYHTTTPMVVPVKRDFIHSGWQNLTHFYVPKGTKKLYFIGSFSGDCTIVNGICYHKKPCKHLMGEVKTSKNGQIQSIPVPEGEDGKVWHFKWTSIQNLWFLNIPNVLSYSPYGMMVPREVAEKDGLQIMTKNKQINGKE